MCRYVKKLTGLHWYRFVTRLSSHSLDSTCLSSTFFGSIPANFWPASKGTEENLCSCHIITISLPLKTSSRNGEGREEEGRNITILLLQAPMHRHSARAWARAHIISSTQTPSYVRDIARHCGNISKILTLYGDQMT